MPITFKRGQIRYRKSNGDYENIAAVGHDGNNAHVYIRYSAERPTEDADMKTTPDAWIGINSGREGVEPAHYTDYQWYKIKGDVGYGVPAGGSTNQVLGKVSGTSYDVGWINQQDISGKINMTEKGAANGVAELDSTGKVPPSQLPSYVDDVVNGYLYNGAFYQDEQHQHVITGEDSKIYIDLTTEKTYRWSGSVYAEISKSLALGTTSSTAYRGDRGQTAYSHATDASRTTTAKASGLYKVAVTNEGHVAGTEDVAKSDLTALGVADATDTVLQTTLSRGRKSETTVGTGSLAFGNDVEASAMYSQAFGVSTKATAYRAHAEGLSTVASANDAHAEGSSTTASDSMSHAEGYHSTASGYVSHAEGGYTTASGSHSHAQGSETIASGYAAHAEGSQSIASGENSHAEGRGTTANHKSQHAGGEFNVADPSSAAATARGTYAEIIGNGTSSNAQSNARALDWDGNEYIKGTLRVGCNADSSGGTEVATVDDIPDVSGFYSKPNTGIPNTDLASGVQTSLGKADTAYQKPSGGIPASDMASGVIPDVSGFYTKPQTGIPASDLASGVIPDVSGFYTKPSGGIPASDIASGVIPTVHNVPAGGSAGQVLAKNSGTDYDLKWVNQSGGGGSVTVDDELSDSSTNPVQNKVITGAIAYVAPKDPVTIPFVDNTWINGSGVAETDNTYEATDYIDLNGIVAIAYTGKCGSSRSVFWYDDEKNFLSYSLQLDDRMAWFENIMVYKPDDAAYVRIQSKKLTASNPPDIAPEVTAYLDDKYIEVLKAGIVGDGVTDDTLAVQKIVNMSEAVVFPKRDTILITAPIDVRMGYARILDGNGCNIVVDDDFYALSITGTLRTASEATGMDAFVVANEAGLLVKNFRITSEDITEGGGIQITKSFKAKLCDNYIHHMANGIRVYGQNRDMIISNNQMITFTNNGILFDQGVNLHQCNIVNNMIQYAHDIIHIYHPSAIANFQIVGNDIEIVNYPASTYETATCICFESYSSCDQFSEIEICGNSIQGHDTSDYLIVLTGVDDHEIKHTTINGNHISNSSDCAISLKNVQNITINGNNYAEIKHFVYELDGTCENIMISGESGIGINQGTVADGGKLHAASGATLSGVRCKNIQFNKDTVSLATSNITDVDLYDEKDITVSGSTPTISAVPSARYICGEVSSLSFTPCTKGVCEVVFTSGSTPTTLTVPITVKWSDDFDPSDLDASTTYALNILNGTMGVAAKWV